MEFLKKELLEWLDNQTITPDNIEEICKKCLVPWCSRWNGDVRLEVEKRVTNSVKAKKILAEAQEAIRKLGFACDTTYELVKLQQGDPVKVSK